MFVRTTAYTSKTGTREFDFPFQCEHCRVSAMARVWSEGSATSVAVYGVGGNADSARNAAEQTAHKNALATLASAPCPRCGAYSSTVMAAEHRLRTTAQARLRHRVACASLAGLATFSLFGGAALLAHSAWFFAASLGASLAAGGLVFAIMSRSTTMPAKGAPANVRFWSAQTQEGPSFFPPASATPMPREVVGSTRGVQGGMGALALGGSLFMVGLVLAATGSKKVYAVNTEATGPMTVRLDGKTTTVQHERAGYDAGYAELSVPLGAHVIEALDESGAIVARAEFTAERWSSGYLFTPAGTKRGACVVAEPGPVMNSVDFVRLPDALAQDAMFRRPASRPSKQNPTQPETRRALRVYACASLGDDSAAPVAFAPSEAPPPITPRAKPTAPTRPASAPRR